MEAPIASADPSQPAVSAPSPSAGLPPPVGTPSGRGQRPATSPLAGTSGSGRPGSSSGRPLAPSRPDYAATIGDVRWGSTEGGLDRLAWVRQIVKYTESSLIFDPADDRSSEVAPTGDALGFTRTVFPSLKPNRREDVLLLQNWLLDMLRHYVLDVSGRDGAPALLVPATTPAEAAEGVMYVYDLAVEELRRQVSSECRERGELMAALWDHYMNLVQLCSAVAAEAKVTTLQERAGVALAENAALAEALATTEAALAEARRDAETAASEAATAKKVLMQRAAVAQAAAAEGEKRARVAEVTLQEETERRLSAEEELLRLREALHRSEAELAKSQAEAKQLGTSYSQQLGISAKLNKQLEESGHSLMLRTRELDKMAEENAVLKKQDLDARATHDADLLLLASLKTQIDGLKAELASVKSLRDELDSGMRLFQERCELLERQKAGLQEELEAALADATSLRGELLDQGGRLAATQQREAALQKQLADTRGALALTDQERAQLVDQVAQLNGQVSGLEKDVASLEGANVIADGKVAELETELAVLRELAKEVVPQLEELLVPNVPSAADKCWSRLGAQGGAQRLLTLVRGALADAFSRQAELQAKLRVELRDAAALQQELAATRDSESNLLATIAERDAFVRQLELDIDGLKAQLEANDNERRGLQDQVAQLQALSAAQVAKLQAMASFPQLLEANQQMLEELGWVKHKLEEARRANGLLEADTLRYKAEMENSLGVIQDLNAELQGLRLTAREAEYVRAERDKAQADYTALAVS